MASNTTVAYMTQFPRQALGALQSNKMAPGEYDPHGMLENNTGKLYTETLTIGERVLQSTAIYSPSPTVSDAIALEARALLQSSENNLDLPPDELNAEKYKITKWFFTSLQDLANKHEGPRARAIKALNLEYPLSFTGITLSVDSKFYRAGIHGSNPEKILRAKIENGAQGLSLDYAEQMKKEFLENPQYSFPVSTDAEIHQWQQDLGKIIDEAFAHIPLAPQKDLRGDDMKLWNWNQKAAFRELVMLGTQRYWQMRSIPPRGDMITTTACKEDIDRGGIKMAQELRIRCKETPENENFTIACANGRALSARSRLILPDRLEPALAEMELVIHKDAQHFLANIPLGQLPSAIPCLS
jgi:hypothetical protein